MDKVTLQLPAKADFLLTARLAASSIGSRLGISIDRIEDLKTAVSEACNIIMYQGSFGNLNINFNLNHSQLDVSVAGSESGGQMPMVEADLEMSQYILDAMADDLRIVTDSSGVIYEINFTIGAGEEVF